MIINDRVEINPRIILSKPMIRGTRITVDLIVRKLSEGAKEGDLINAYHRPRVEGTRAALAYGAVSHAHEEVILHQTGASNVEADDSTPDR